MFQLKSYGPQDTQMLGEKFARILKPGDCIGLIGELGSGKTAFVAGVGAGLGYREIITSPTFTLLHLYLSVPPLCHFDCFRIKSPPEIATAGFDEFLASGQGVIIVEWADLIKDYFSDWSYEVEFTFDYGGDQQRVIQFSTRQGGRSKLLYDFFATALKEA